MFSFFSRPILGGDPASEMEAFIDERKRTASQRTQATAHVESTQTEQTEYEIGHVVGRRGSNFLVKVGHEVREVPPTSIERVIRNG